MRFIVFFVVLVGLASCSSPKYTYRFPVSPSIYGEQVTDRKHEQKNVQRNEQSTTPVLVASSNEEKAFSLTEETPAVQPSRKNKEVPSVKQVVKKLKSAAKQANEELRSAVAPASSLDEDLKLAILFGVVGIVALVLLVLSKLFGILGGIALIIATIYFVRWFLEQ